MSFTYAQLKQAIQDYTENDETTFVNNLPLFIRLSEERILKNVQLSLFRKNATATTTASSKYLACPSDFLAPFSLSLLVQMAISSLLNLRTQASCKAIHLTEPPRVRHDTIQCLMLRTFCWPQHPTPRTRPSFTISTVL